MRLLNIEFHKLKSTKYFWVLTGLFALMLMAIPYGAHRFVGMLNEGSEAIVGMDGIGMPFFDFVDIWQNLYFVIKWFSVYLGFIVVISLSNDMSYGIMKQNIIDGMSRQEYLLSKVHMIIGLSLVFTLISALIILFMGFVHSPVTDLEFILEHIEFVPAYFLHLVAFQLFCAAVTLMIKRSGITIAFLLFYVFMIEPILAAVMMNYGLGAIAEFLPVNAIGNIIRFPFYKYALQETQTTVAFKDLAILVAYIGGLYWWNRKLVVDRDLT